MEKLSKVQPKRSDRKPSFSSTLLDTIYRSMDEPNVTGGAPDHSRPLTTIPAKQATTTIKNNYKSTPTPAVTRPRRYLPPISATSSSENSSYCNLSSSDAESVGPFPVRLRPIRTGAPPTRPNSNRTANRPQKNISSYLSKSSINDYKNDEKAISKSNSSLQSKAPASPGARLAGFINSIIAAAGRNPRKSKVKKTPSVPAIVAVDVRMSSPLDDDDDDAFSESSDELFELENLNCYRDELPVYETTKLIERKK